MKKRNSTFVLLLILNIFLMRGQVVELDILLNRRIEVRILERLDFDEIISNSNFKIDTVLSKKINKEVYVSLKNDQYILKSTSYGRYAESFSSKDDLLLYLKFGEISISREDGSIFVATLYDGILTQKIIKEYKGNIIETISTKREKVYLLNNNKILKCFYYEDSTIEGSTCFQSIDDMLILDPIDDLPEDIDINFWGRQRKILKLEGKSLDVNLLSKKFLFSNLLLKESDITELKKGKTITLKDGSKIFELIDNLVYLQFSNITDYESAIKTILEAKNLETDSFNYIIEDSNIDTRISRFFNIDVTELNNYSLRSLRIIDNKINEYFVNTYFLNQIIYSLLVYVGNVFQNEFGYKLIFVKDRNEMKSYPTLFKDNRELDYAKYLISEIISMNKGTPFSLYAFVLGIKIGQQM